MEFHHFWPFFQERVIFGGYPPVFSGWVKNGRFGVTFSQKWWYPTGFDTNLHFRFFPKNGDIPPVFSLFLKKGHFRWNSTSFLPFFKKGSFLVVFHQFSPFFQKRVIFGGKPPVFPFCSEKGKIGGIPPFFAYFTCLPNHVKQTCRRKKNSKPLARKLRASHRDGFTQKTFRKRLARARKYLKILYAARARSQ